MRKLLSILCVLLLVGSAFAATEDAAPVMGECAPTMETDVQWDILLDIDAEALVVDNQLLGCEFAMNKWFVTGGGNALDPNKLYILNSTATAVLQTVNQPAAVTGWGWRDMAFDGTYLYAGSEATTIYAINPTDGSLVTAMNIPRPAGNTCVRALAYDPVSDHFWTGNFGSNFQEFSRAGTVIWQGLPPTGWSGVYGMAWDNAPGHSALLWIHDQTGTPQTQIKSYNPVTHAAAGVVHQLQMLSGLTAQIAGGLGFTNQWNPAFYTFFGIVQGTAHDKLFALEMYPSQVTPLNIQITLSPIGAPITIPAAGGSFSYNGTVQNLEASAASFQVWTKWRLPNGTWSGPLLGPINLNNVPAGANITRQRNQNVAGTQPSGVYTYVGYTGNYASNVIFDSSFFTFTKSATDMGGEFVYNNDNWGESFEVDNTVAPADYALLSNYPNPFNPSTTISYTLAQSGQVTLAVFDLSGRQVAQLVNGHREAGQHQVTFDASQLASGVYLYRLTSAGATVSAKMVLTK